MQHLETGEAVSPPEKDSSRLARPASMTQMADMKALQQ
jgi:hypothetical protein